jgi:hypothetical protein
MTQSLTMLSHIPGGNPFSVYQSKEDAEKSEETYKAELPVLYNDAVFMVGTNLYDALVNIRRAKREKRPTFEQLYKGLKSTPVVGKHIWIDAICINQQDIVEKNSQISMMDRVYKTASVVLIWLGPHDFFSRIAMETMSVLANASIDSARKFQLSRGLQSSQYEELGLTPLSPLHWLALFAFLERRWFRRAWIIQEVALAKIAVVVCGTLYFPWNGLSNLANWLRESRCFTIVWEEGTMRSLEIFSISSKMYRVEEKSPRHGIGDQNPVITIFKLTDG